MGGASGMAVGQLPPVPCTGVAPNLLLSAKGLSPHYVIYPDVLCRVHRTHAEPSARGAAP